jgi:putative ABC transport system substrate-binding protein
MTSEARRTTVTEMRRERITRPRRRWWLVLAFALLAAPSGLEAQPAGKIARIGVMYAGSAPNPGAEALRRGLADLGWVEGRSLLIEERYAEGRPDRYPALIEELIRLHVDVLVTGGGTAGALAAKRATQTIPIVMPVTGDPVAAGLVSSLARPGGNVTGLSMLNTEISAKRVELLREVLPRIERVAVLRDPAAPPADLDATQAAARSLGFRLQLLSASRPEEFDGVFQVARKSRAEALIVLASGFFNTQRRRLVDLAAQHRLVTVWEHRDFAEAGGLMSYGPNLLDMNRRAARYVDRILKGAKPGDLPVEQATTFELVINRKAARALAITIPPAVLARADEVIQ